MTSAPLFILGAPRSGTSLLYRVLCLHPQAAWVNNYLRRAPRRPEVSLLNRIPSALPGLADRVWFGEDSNAYVYGERRPLLHRLTPQPTEAETLFENCGLPENPAEMTMPEDQRNANIRLAFEQIRRWSGAPVVVSKRIGHNRRVAALHSAFPDARFLTLVRDGRAVALSLTKVDWWPSLDVWWYGGTPARWESEGGDPWELAGRHWVQECGAIDDGISGVPRAQRMTLRYEDLVADPNAALDRVRDFSGLRPDTAWRSRIATLRFPNRNERWRQEIDEVDLKTIESVQCDELARQGYSI